MEENKNAKKVEFSFKVKDYPEWKKISSGTKFHKKFQMYKNSFPKKQGKLCKRVKYQPLSRSLYYQYIHSSCFQNYAKMF